LEKELEGVAVVLQVPVVVAVVWLKLEKELRMK
jgi:hypothetical protein